MPITQDSATAGEHLREVSAPVLLIELGITSPLYLSSVGDLTWDGKSFVGATVERFRLGDEGSLTFFNEDAVLGATLLADGVAGKPIKVWNAFKFERVNLLRYTEDFSTGWVTTSTTLTEQGLNYEGAPAYKLRENAPVSTHKLHQNLQTADVPDNTSVTLQVDVKVSAGARQLYLQFLKKNGTTDTARFNIGAGTVTSGGADATITPVADGWLRVTFKSNTSSGGTTPQMVIGLADGSNLSYDGDAASAFLITRPQFQLGVNARIYQPVPGTWYTAPVGAPSGYTEPQLIFDGEMTTLRVNRSVQIRCTPPGASMMIPRHTIDNPICNHLPRAGQRFETANGIVILE